MSTRRRRHVLDPREVQFHTGGVLSAVWNESILSLHSTWAVAIALLLAPVPGAHPPLQGFTTSASDRYGSLSLPLFTAFVPVTAMFSQHGRLVKPVEMAAIYPQRAPDATIDGYSVTITAYASEVQHTDDEPFITATGRTVRPGIIAVSRDLLRTFTPGAPFDYGDRVRLSRLGEFIVDDTMNSRWTKRVDIWVPTLEEARQFGLRRGQLYSLAG